MTVKKSAPSKAAKSTASTKAAPAEDKKKTAAKPAA